MVYSDLTATDPALGDWLLSACDRQDFAPFVTSSFEAPIRDLYNAIIEMEPLRRAMFKRAVVQAIADWRSPLNEPTSLPDLSMLAAFLGVNVVAFSIRDHLAPLVRIRRKQLPSRLYRSVVLTIAALSHFPTSPEVVVALESLMYGNDLQREHLRQLVLILCGGNPIDYRRYLDFYAEQGDNSKLVRETTSRCVNLMPIRLALKHSNITSSKNGCWLVLLSVLRDYDEISSDLSQITSSSDFARAEYSERHQIIDGRPRLSVVRNILRQG